MKCLKEILGEIQTNVPCVDCKKYDPFIAFSNNPDCKECGYHVILQFLGTVLKYEKGCTLCKHYDGNDSLQEYHCGMSFNSYQECNGDMMAIDWEKVNKKYETEVKR